MKRKLRNLLTFAAMLVLVMAMSTGVAYADHGDISPAFGDEVGDAPSPAPVGSNISPAGATNGFFENPNSNALAAVANNPNCPLHYR